MRQRSLPRLPVRVRLQLAADLVLFGSFGFRQVSGDIARQSLSG